MLCFTPVTLLFSIMPAILAKKGVQTRMIMLVLATITFVATLLKINVLYDEAENIYFYIFSSGLLLTATLATEVSLTSLLGTITPVHINASFWSAGIILWSF